MSTRSLLLGGAVLGVCHLAGVPVIDWVLSAVQLCVYAVTALLWAFWQLLQPTQENRHSNLPELHQAVLNVTNDASRVADLLDEFMSGQYSSDGQLRAKFLQFMAQQADTKYSVVDNQLNWVLWLYSLIWMPLLVLMCLTRMGRSAASSLSSASSAEQQQQLQRQAAGAPTTTAPVSNGLGQQQQQMAQGAAGLRLRTASSAHYTHEYGFNSISSSRRGAAGTASLDLPPRYSVPGSFGRPLSYAGLDAADTTDGASSMRSGASGSGRSLRHSMSSGAARHAAPQRAQSDRLHMSRPSKLQGSASLPPPQGLLVAAAKRGSGSSSSVGGIRGSSGNFSHAGGHHGGADVRSVDQAVLLGSGCAGGGAAGASSGAGWASKGQQQQQDSGGSGSTGYAALGNDAAAAADGL